MRARLAFTIATLVAAVALPARADDDIVLGPVAAGASAQQVQEVAVVVAKSLVGTMSTRQIDATCANDADCLATAGSEAGARRVIAVSVAPAPGKSLRVGVMLVDVQAKLLLGAHTFTLPEKKLGKTLAPALKKFLDDAPTQKAKAIFQEASQHFNLGEFDKALVQYKLAYRLKPLPAFLFNIAQCHRKLGQHAEAIAMYQSYLVGVPDAENKAIVESLIAESKAALEAEQAQAAQAAREAAERQAKLEAERIEADKRKADDARRAKEAEAHAAEEARKAELARIAADKERYDRHPMRSWMLASGALGAVAMGVGGYFGVEANKQQQDFDHLGCGDSSVLLPATDLATCKAYQRHGQDDALFSDAFLIGGGAALLASAVVFWIDPGNVERPDRPRAHVSVSPTSVRLEVTW